LSVVISELVGRLFAGSFSLWFLHCVYRVIGCVEEVVGCLVEKVSGTLVHIGFSECGPSD
jgi:hypothetical protein